MFQCMSSFFPLTHWLLGFRMTYSTFEHHGEEHAECRFVGWSSWGRSPGPVGDADRQDSPWRACSQFSVIPTQHHRAKMDTSMTCGVIESVSVDNHNSSGTSRQQEQKGHYFLFYFLISLPCTTWSLVVRCFNWQILLR